MARFAQRVRRSGSFEVKRRYSAGLSGRTEKFFDFWPSAAPEKPSAIMPRLSSSRIAAALLGIRFANRHVSTDRSSSCVSMIWRRSPLLISPISVYPSGETPLQRKKPTMSCSLIILTKEKWGISQLGPKRLLRHRQLIELTNIFLKCGVLRRTLAPWRAWMSSLNQLSSSADELEARPEVTTDSTNAWR